MKCFRRVSLFISLYPPPVYLRNLATSDFLQTTDNAEKQQLAPGQLYSPLTQSTDTHTKLSHGNVKLAPKYEDVSVHTFFQVLNALPQEMSPNTH